MTPWGQTLTVLHHCMAGQSARARALIAWIPAERRREQPYRDFLAWANGGCA
jgi:hypothetical protein